MATKTKKQRHITSRHILVACLFVAWMGVIIWRLSYLQIVRHEELFERARMQRSPSETVKAFRGDIVDRRGIVLATSTKADSVIADLYQIKPETKEKVIKAIAPILDLNESDLWNKFQGKNKAPVLKQKLAPETSNYLRTTLETNQLTGIKIVSDTKRAYPQGQLAAHILGYVNAAEQGVTGLELELNQKLAGTNGKTMYEKDGWGQAFNRIDYAAVAGARVITTIDIALQHKVEAALTKAVTETKSDRASAIVMDPATGEILAIANAPTFVPGTNPSQAEMEQNARRNSAITDIYEPGSVFKIVTYSAAIQEGIVTADEKIHCGNGQIVLGSRVIRDAHPYGELTVAQALAKSSNVAAIKIAMRVGNEKFHDYITRFGFGTPTKIDLPYEAKGLVRPVNKWGSTSIASMAMGHEIGVTALQAVSAMAAIANNGVLVQPHIVKQIVTGDAGQRSLYEAKPESRRVISEQTATTIRPMLQDVVEAGTAKKARINGYTIAGKTGTAQKVVNGTYSNSSYVASFAGFAPASNPRFAVIVVLDNPKGAHQGGQVAAPVFTEIVKAALTDYSVLPDSSTHQQEMVALNEKFRATTTTSQIAETAPVPALTTATPKTATVTSPTKPSPQSTPVLQLPTAKAEMRSALVTKPTATPKPQPSKVPTPKAAQSKAASTGATPAVLGKSLREVATICSQAGLKLKAIGVGVARNQRRQGDTLIVEFK